MNFALFLEIKARTSPDDLALVDQRLRLTWAELDSWSNRLAATLSHRGMGRGDRMAVLLPNRAEAVITLLGCMKAGVVAVPLNWRLAGQELYRVVAHCKPGCLLTTQERAQELGSHLKGSALLMSLGDNTKEGSFWSAIQDAQPRYRAAPCQSADVANLLYTSGTTSTPKAAIHTHGMRVAVAAAMADCFELSGRDVALCISPLFHTSGLSVFSNAIFAGCTLILQEKWDLDQFVQLVAKERVTFMHMIGTLVVDIASAPAAVFEPLKGRSRMRFTWGGGHSLSPDSFLAFEERVGGVFLQGYSRTEGGLSYNPLDITKRRFDHNGLPNRNSSELAIIDPSTKLRCADGVIGEVCFKGDGVSPGYWDGAYIRFVPSYDGGWQPTADLGFIDPEGNLHFLGRDDHMIKTGGENVFPDEVVSVLLAMPQVSDAVVLGLPDERLGQRVAAVVVASDPQLSRPQIDKACRAALGAYKIPRSVAFVQALPRLGSGKVDLAACRALLEAQTITAE